nr:MAG TPA: Fibroin heavy chain DOUBLE-LAYERED-SHEETS, FIBROIN FOLDING INITIATION.0A [Crassvirales sp.]
MNNFIRGNKLITYFLFIFFIFCCILQLISVFLPKI